MTLKNESGTVKIGYQIAISLLVYAILIGIAYETLAPKTYVDTKVSAVESNLEKKIERHEDLNREDMKEIQRKFDRILDRLPQKGTKP